MHGSCGSLKNPCPGELARYYDCRTIPGTPHFTVDGFRFVRPSCKHYFLSHFHADHYDGLTSRFKAGTIYCSKITGIDHAPALLAAGLVTKQLRVKPPTLQVLEDTQTIEGVEVSLVDAHHCPGAVIFVFGTPTGTHVHTGDFRYHPSMAFAPALASRTVTAPADVGQRPGDVHQPASCLFMALPCIPVSPNLLYPVFKAHHPWHSQANTVDKIVDLAHAAWWSQGVVLVGTYTIGKEKVLLGLHRRYGLRIGVTKQKHALLGISGFDMEVFVPEGHPEYRTLKAYAVPMRLLGWRAVGELLESNTLSTTGRALSEYSQVAAVQPTGWSMNAGGFYKKRTQSIFTVHSVAYSEHSSFPELVQMVRVVKPGRVVPTVDTTGYQKHISHFQHLLRGAPPRQVQSKLLSFGITKKCAQPPGSAAGTRNESQVTPEFAEVDVDAWDWGDGGDGALDADDQGSPCAFTDSISTDAVLPGIDSDSQPPAVDNPSTETGTACQGPPAEDTESQCPFGEGLEKADFVVYDLACDDLGTPASKAISQRLSLSLGICPPSCDTTDSLDHQNNSIENGVPASTAPLASQPSQPDGVDSDAELADTAEIEPGATASSLSVQSVKPAQEYLPEAPDHDHEALAEAQASLIASPPHPVVAWTRDVAGKLLSNPLLVGKIRDLNALGRLGTITDESLATCPLADIASDLWPKVPQRSEAWFSGRREVACGTASEIPTCIAVNINFPYPSPQDRRQRWAERLGAPSAPFTPMFEACTAWGSAMEEGACAELAIAIEDVRVDEVGAVLLPAEALLQPALQLGLPPECVPASSDLKFLVSPDGLLSCAHCQHPAQARTCHQAVPGSNSTGIVDPPPTKSHTSPAAGQKTLFRPAQQPSSGSPVGQETSPTNSGTPVALSDAMGEYVSAARNPHLPPHLNHLVGMLEIKCAAPIYNHPESGLQWDWDKPGKKLYPSAAHIPFTYLAQMSLQALAGVYQFSAKSLFCALCPMSYSYPPVDGPVPNCGPDLPSNPYARPTHPLVAAAETELAAFHGKQWRDVNDVSDGQVIMCRWSPERYSLTQLSLRPMALSGLCAALLYVSIYSRVQSAKSPEASDFLTEPEKALQKIQMEFLRISTTRASTTVLRSQLAPAWPEVRNPPSPPQQPQAQNTLSGQPNPQLQVPLVARPQDLHKSAKCTVFSAAKSQVAIQKVPCPSSALASIYKNDLPQSKLASLSHGSVPADATTPQSSACPKLARQLPRTDLLALPNNPGRSAAPAGCVDPLEGEVLVLAAGSKLTTSQSSSVILIAEGEPSEPVGSPRPD
eukprot:gene2971-582_t